MDDSGEGRKQAGIDRVMSGTSDAWKARTTGLFRVYMARNPAGFTAEDCKVFARNNGHSEPHHPNVWSGVWNGIARTKHIVKTDDFVKSKLPSRHANEVRVWRLNY